MEKPWDLRERTILFSVSVIRFCRTLPKSAQCAEIASQLRRSSSSNGAHFCAAQRCKSQRDYITKITGGIEEADEACTGSTCLSTPTSVPGQLQQSYEPKRTNSLASWSKQERRREKDKSDRQPAQRFVLSSFFLQNINKIHRKNKISKN